MSNLILNNVEGNRSLKQALEISGYLTSRNDKMIALGGCENPLWSNWTGFEFENFTIDISEEALNETIKEAASTFNVDFNHAKEMLGL